MQVEKEGPFERGRVAMKGERGEAAVLEYQGIPIQGSSRGSPVMLYEMDMFSLRH